MESKFGIKVWNQSLESKLGIKVWNQVWNLSLNINITGFLNITVLYACTRSGVIRCTLLMVLYLDPMCQCGLHAVLWSHIVTLMHRLAAEPRSTKGLLFPYQCPSGTILLTPYSMVWDWPVSRAGPMLFIDLRCSIPTIVFYYFFLSRLSVYRLVL